MSPLLQISTAVENHERAYACSWVGIRNNAHVASWSPSVRFIYELAREEAIVVMTKVLERLSPNKQQQGSHLSQASPEKIYTSNDTQWPSDRCNFSFFSCIRKKTPNSGSSLTWEITFLTSECILLFFFIVAGLFFMDGYTRKVWGTELTSTWLDA